MFKFEIGCFFVAFLALSIKVATPATLPDVQSEMAKQFDQQATCLAKNIYHEARGESIEGQRAVAYVTINRAVHKHYPDTICDVVYQAHRDANGQPIRNKCHFSWYCDGKADVIKNEELYAEIKALAAQVLWNYTREDANDPTKGAIMYHATYVNPYWAPHYKKTVQIDTHIFYK